MNISILVKEINRVSRRIKAKDINAIVEAVINSKKIYCMGEGRSGLALKAFAMRLARLGKLVYIVGETVTPAIDEGDLLLAVSGSGETKTVLETVKICRVMRGTVLSLTAVPESSLVKLSHSYVLIQAELPKRLGHVYQLRELIGVPERPPLASIFELVSLIILEVVAFQLESVYRKHRKGRKLLPS